MTTLSRRGFITGLTGLVAAPAVLKLGLYMPVRPLTKMPERFFLPAAPLSGRTWLCQEWLPFTVSEEEWRPEMATFVLRDF